VYVSYDGWFALELSVESRKLVNNREKWRFAKVVKLKKDDAHARRITYEFPFEAAVAQGVKDVKDRLETGLLTGT